MCCPYFSAEWNEFKPVVMQGISTSYQEWKITAEQVSQLVGILQMEQRLRLFGSCHFNPYTSATYLCTSTIYTVNN